jgi:hypothetical protein
MQSTHQASQPLNDWQGNAAEDRDGNDDRERVSTYKKERSSPTFFATIDPQRHGKPRQAVRVKTDHGIIPRTRLTWQDYFLLDGQHSAAATSA